MNSAHQDITEGGYTLYNYNGLLTKYADEMKARLEYWGNLESNIPLTDEYYSLRRKYQTVVNKFKP